MTNHHHHLAKTLNMKLKHTILTACAVALASTASAERNYLAWGHRYDTTNQNATTRGVAVATDRRGNVCMTGYRDIANDTWYTVKYDALTGLVVWEKSYSNGLEDRPTAITTGSPTSFHCTTTSVTRRSSPASPWTSPIASAPSRRKRRRPRRSAGRRRGSRRCCESPRA